MSKRSKLEPNKRQAKGSLKSSNNNRTCKVNVRPGKGKFFEFGKDKKSQSIDNSLQIGPTVDFLDKLNFIYETNLDPETNENCFFMRDKYMNDFFSGYPEYICIDILCELPKLDKCLVLFIGLDTNGYCEIVSLGLIQSGNQKDFFWLCEIFKKYNPDWKKIEFILSDQCCDRDILLKVFPDKFIFISFFHCMKAFRKDISNLDPGIANQDLNKVFQIFEQMMFATSDSAYMDLVKQMKQMHPQVFSLFKKNWHAKKDIWALGLCCDIKVVLKAFNRYLLDIRKKMKPIISTQETLENVVKNFHSTAIKLRKEFFQKFTCLFPPPLATCSKKQAVQKYSRYFTRFAAELVNEQINLSENIGSVIKNEHCSYKVNEAIASITECSCSFYSLMKLPCGHIFAVRKFLSLPLYVEMGRPNWISKNYQDKYFELHGTHASDDELKERYKDLVLTFKDVWHEMLNCPESVSQERVEIYQDLLKVWKNNFVVEIKVFDKPFDLPSSSNEGLENKSTDYFEEMYGLSINDILDSENDFSSVSLCSTDENDLF